jgi:hypothetical protein
MPVPPYIPENDVDEALENLLHARIGHLTDNGGEFLFEGDALDAFNARIAAQGFTWERGALVLFGTARTTPVVASTSGAPVHVTMAIEVLIVLRGRGAPHYRDDVRAVKRLSDMLTWSVFYEETGALTEFQRTVQKVVYAGGARVVMGAGFFGRTLQFNVTPHRERIPR